MPSTSEPAVPSSTPDREGEDASFAIAGRPIGPGHPPFIVAEVSANHEGKLEKARDIIRAASDAGAHAVKLQTYTAETLTLDHDGPEFRIHGGLWDGYTLYRLYQEAHTPWDWHESLFELGRDLGIPVFSTPFDPTAVDFLEQFDPPAYKVASFEVVDTPLVETIARTGKPVIMSTGMADLAEIQHAVDAARRGGAGGLALLHCVSSYPARPEEANLRTVPHLGQTFHAVPGLSDHTLGIEVALTAVALGACLIEKHFTLRRDDGGLDAAFSLEPPELAALVEGSRTAWTALGRITYERQPGEQRNLLLRRSLYVAEDIEQGEPFTRQNVRSVRPARGLAPRHLEQVLTRRARRNLSRGTPLDWSMVD